MDKLQQGRGQMILEPENASYQYQLQHMRARVESLIAAGDKMSRWVPKSCHKARKVLETWKLTKVGGKRADRKKD